MHRIIRNNQKKILAVFGAFLMVVFVVQLAPQGQGGGRTPVTAGTIDGTKVNQADISASAREWRLLTQMGFINPNKPDAKPLKFVEVVLGENSLDLGNSLASQINSNPATFFLLKEEARRQGVVVLPEQVESLMTNNVESPPAEGTDEYDQMALAVHDCLMVNKLLQHVSSLIKVSKPLQEWWLAREAQILSVKFVGFPASSYMSQVKAPGDADIRTQYDNFKDQQPAQVGQQPSQYGREDDPLGFGYQIPNRVQVQYIGVDYDDVHTAALASKSSEDWYAAAYAEFLLRRDTYDAQDVTPPATQPTTRPGETAGEPTTRPAVHKLEDVQADFEMHVSLVLDVLYMQETMTLERAISKTITDKMNSGFGAYRDAQAVGATTQPGGARQYTSEQFMKDLAALVQSQHGVRAMVGNIRNFKTVDQLRQISGIGDARSGIPGSEQESIAFPQYATALYQPWMTDSLKSSQVASMALVEWQPSGPLINDHRDLYIFRISGTDAAHTPPLADIREQVIDDWKLSQAYGLARDAADAFLIRAQRQGIDDAAAEAKFGVPTVTDPFNPHQMLNGRSKPDIQPLKLNPDSALELADAAQQLLTTTPGENKRPQSVVQLYGDAMAAVVELNQASPLWQPEEQSTYLSEVIGQYGQAEREPLLAAFCNYDAVAGRLNFHPQTKDNSSE